MACRLLLAPSLFCLSVASSVLGYLLVAKRQRNASSQRQVMQRHGHHPSVDEIAVPFCCCLFVTRHNQIQQFSDPTYQSIYPGWYGSKCDISSLYHLKICLKKFILQQNRYSNQRKSMISAEPLNFDPQPGRHGQGHGSKRLSSGQKPPAARCQPLDC